MCGLPEMYVCVCVSVQINSEASSFQGLGSLMTQDLAHWDLRAIRSSAI